MEKKAKKAKSKADKELKKMIKDSLDATTDKMENLTVK